MSTHSSALAWKIPWMEEPGTDLAAAAAGLLKSCVSYIFHLSGTSILFLDFITSLAITAKK